jgi:hypothetical protein
MEKPFRRAMDLGSHFSWITRTRRFLVEEFSGTLEFPRSSLGRRVLGMLFAAGIILRTAGLDWGLSPTVPHGPPHHDEPHVVAFITAPWEKFVKEFDEYEIVRPVYFWRVVTKPFFLLGDRFHWNTPKNNVFEFAVPRAVNSVFGILGLIVIYLLGVKLGGVRAGCWALAFLTVMPGHGYYSQILKGDLLGATYHSVLLLAAIFIAERGSRFWYCVAGIAAGVGIASKPSVAVILPVVLLAHIVRAVARKDLRSLVSRNALLAILLAVGSFTVFYPYPFLDFQRLWKLHAEPTTQFFRVNLQPTPASFLASWNAYNEPEKPFMEMVFGNALRLAFPAAAALFAIITLGALRRKRSMSYLLATFGAFLVYHSLSFTGALDDRYVLPLAPFVALFPATALAGSLPVFAHSRTRVLIGTAVGIVLFVYTAGVTLAIFPTFALRKDVRLQVTDFLQTTVKPGERIGEFEPGGRQSLPFDRSRVALTPLRTHGEDPHMFLASSPKYVVFQTEPWNFDHAFRYQLYTPELRNEFQAFLSSYKLVRTFGREPVAFGRRLPRMLSTPVYEVYKRRENIPVETDDLLGAPATWRFSGTLQTVDPKTALSLRKPTAAMSERAWSAEELRGRTLRATMDLSEVQRAWRSGTDFGGTIAFALLLDGASLEDSLPARVPEPESLREENRWVHLIPLQQKDLSEARNLSIAFFFRPDGRVDLASGINGQLVGRDAASHLREFREVRIGVAVTPTTPVPASVRLMSLVLETPDAH